MPAIAKVTKEMIIDAALEIAKEMRAENITARTVSQNSAVQRSPFYIILKRLKMSELQHIKKQANFILTM